jgi:hypothetical protein
VEPSRLEQEVTRRIKRAKLFVWLREHRHELFDADFQAELAGMYQDKPVGQPPTPPAQLALATILQAYTGASDDEVLEACVMDRRWQLVLDCMDHAQAPFSKTTLVAFGARLIEHSLDRRLVERTVALYGQLTGRVAGGKLRAALDSSPLWGAGRVEDTINLLGHALRKALACWRVSRGGAGGGNPGAGHPGGGVGAGGLQREGGVGPGLGRPGCAAARAGGGAGCDGPRGGVAAELGGAGAPRVAAGLAAARQVRDQDVVTDEQGMPQIRRGVTRDRRISIEDPQMRHGRKTKRVRIDGSKRHVLTDLDTDLVPAVGVTPANAAEAEVADQITADLEAQQRTLAELDIDRADLSSSLVRDRDPDLQIFCKAFPVRNGGRFAKPAFTLDFDRGLLTCPNHVTMPFVPGGKVQFPAEVCAACPLQTKCTTSTRGRSVQIHPDERLLAESAPPSRPRTAGPSCASGSRSSTPWPTWAAGRVIVPATWAPARTCSTCVGSRSSTTSTSSPANPHQPNKPPEPDTRPAL